MRGTAPAPGRALVIGAGLIGGSLGLALSHAGWTVFVEDSSPGVRALASELGVGEGATPASVDIVIVATPPDVAATVCHDALTRFESATVIDVASVKEPIAREIFHLAEESGADTSRYVGAHPMAGREVSGVVAARGDLFRGRPFVVCPAPGTSESSLRLARHVGQEIGSVVFEIDARAHDEAVAYVSHVPQLASSLLAARLAHAPSEALAFSGQGLRDTTRIAASDPRLWVEILSANAPHILPILHGLRDDLDRVVEAFDVLCAPQPKPGSRASIATAIARGNDGVSRIPGKHGTGRDTFFRATILIPDEPGQLARFLTDMGEAGINLEDLRLEHSLGQKVGLAHVSIQRDDEKRLLAMMDARGWARAGEE